MEISIEPNANTLFTTHRWIRIAENYTSVSFCHKLWNCKKDIMKVRQCTVHYGNNKEQNIEAKTGYKIHYGMEIYSKRCFSKTIFRKKSYFHHEQSHSMHKKYIKNGLSKILDFLLE